MPPFTKFSLALPSFIMENQINTSFDMEALRTSLPQRRGLSRYYSGKSRSFQCMADVQCLEDLKKQEHGDAKKRKKHNSSSSSRKEITTMHYPPQQYSCTSTRSVTNASQFSTPVIIGM